jgi:hypothetical protein
MAHAQKPDFVFRRNGRVHLNRRGRQFSRLLAAEVCASAVVMLDTPCSEVVWRVLATHSIRQFPLHVPSRASPCAITFQLDSTTYLTKSYVCKTNLMKFSFPYSSHLQFYRAMQVKFLHECRLCLALFSWWKYTNRKIRFMCVGMRLFNLPVCSTFQNVSYWISWCVFD